MSQVLDNATQTERILTTSKAIAEAVAQEMERDPSVFVMGEDVGVYGGIFGSTTGLFERFGEDRIMDTPISETAFIGAATGAAMEGMRPIVELMFVDFFGVCMDQIYNHMAKNIYMSGGNLKIPVVLTTAMGGGYSDAAQHSQCLYGLFAHLPGLKIVVPSNAYDAKGLMISAIRDDNPVIYFMHKGIMGLGWMTPLPEAMAHVPEEAYTIPFGKAAIKQAGDNLTIVTLGIMVHRAVEAAKLLATEGIKAEVIDLRTLVPMDTATIVESVKKTHRLLIVDEDYLSFGMSGEICARVVEEALDYLDAPVKRLAVPDVPVPYSRPMEQFVLPNTEKIAQAARDLARL